MTQRGAAILVIVFTGLMFLSVYLPEGGETGAGNAAAVLGRAIAAAG